MNDLTEKTTTIRDVASRAGVSTATVSRAVNGKSVSIRTRQHVLRVANELGYVPMPSNPPVSTGRVPTDIRLVLCHLTPPERRPSHATAGEGFQMQVIGGIQSEAGHLGPFRFQMSYWQPDMDPKEQIYRFLDTRGLILVGNSDRAMVELLLHQGRTIVLADHEHPGLPVDCVISDNFEAGIEAADYLLRKGHRRIGWFCGLKGVSAFQQRLDGVQARLSREGLRIEPKHRQEIDQIPPVDDDALDDQARRWLDAGDLPTAIICPNAHRAFMLKQVLEEKGLVVGRDISLLAMDANSATRALRPKLTSLTSFPQEIGRQAMDLLAQRLAGSNHNSLLPKKLVLPMQFLEGESVRVM
jgi:DNA-binding LacI/PurR family transcriptional regulator